MQTTHKLCVTQLRLLGPGGFRRGGAMFSGQERPRLLSHPDRSNQQIHRSLEKRRMIALDAMPQEQKHPSADERSRSPGPFQENEQYKPHENHGDANTVQ